MKSFLSHASQLSGTSTLLLDFSHHPAPSFSVLTGGEQGASDSYCITGIVLPSVVGETSRLRNSHLEAWNRWWLWHSLLTWQELLHFTDISLANSLTYCLYNEANLDTLSWIATLLPQLHPAHVSLFYSTVIHTHTIFLFIIFILSVFHWECSSTETGIFVCLNHWCTYAKIVSDIVNTQ